MIERPALDRDAVLRALQAMSDHLARAGTSADVWVYGGAAMVLAYRARTATRDIDAVWEDDSAVRRAADLTAEQLGLPRSWLNDQAASYVPQRARQDPRAFFDEPVFEDAVLRHCGMAEDEKIGHSGGSGEAHDRALICDLQR